MAEREEETTKEQSPKRALMGSGKLPIDAIVLVVVPFIAFLLFFLYVSGVIPPTPIIVEGELPQEEGKTEIKATPASEEKSPVGTEEEAVEKPSQAQEPGEEKTRVETENKAQPEEQALGTAETEESKMAKVVVEPKETAVPAEAIDERAAQEMRLQKYKQIAKVYEQMNASSVAAIVSNLSDEEAVQILSLMKARSAAKVLAALDPERAARLSLLLGR